MPHRALIEPTAGLTHLEVAGSDATAVLRIDGLVCSACAVRVRSRLEDVDGVSSARVDLERGEARVVYDATYATPEALVAAVESAVPFRPQRRVLAAVSGHSRP